MRTPSPESEGNAERARGRDGPGPSTGGDGDGDPGRYLTDRQRSAGGGKRPKRMWSSRLPLERMPEQSRTQATARTVRSSCDEVRRLMGQQCAVDGYVDCGRLAAALPFRDMAEAQLVDGRLRRAVEAWAVRTGCEAELDFTLLWEAKGKRRC
ncbi:hypothetical protein CDD83_10325 [Cordyceps sp. RAO-2017]|nr:hypothetical protein CDD83_10325 [Cordyceps sp. RAO-2017]